LKGVGYYPPKTVSDLKELIRKSVEKYGDSIGFKYKDPAGNIICRTYKEFGRDIDCLGTALLSLGLKNNRISVIGENRYEWGVCFFSIVNGTGVAVPLDKYLPAIEIENLINRGKVEAIFYSPSFHDIMLKLAEKDKAIKFYICMEKLDGIDSNDKRFLSLPELIDKGGNLIENGDASFINAKIDKNAMSILLFTSGTTSLSKGVMLSHANIAANITSITTVIRVKPEDTHLSILPLHHTFENTVGFIFMIHSGACIAYMEGFKQIAQNIKEFNVSLLVAVPAVFEAMYRKLWDGVKKAKKENIFRVLLAVSDFLRFMGIDIRRKIFKSILNQIGPNLRLAVSGAAPLDAEVIKGFDKIGFKILQGYGLTEASPVVAANNDFINVPGTIGYPLGGIEVTIDNPDESGMGELLARGGNIMLGYYEDPAATSETLSKDGWLRTGDLATIDKKGLIRITGRAKSMIVFTNGKKAFPEEYEILLNQIPGVKESFAWGNKAPDGDIQVCAKLVLDGEKLVDENGKSIPEEQVSQEIGKAVQEINKLLPKYKIIRYFVMTHESLQKTTTLKIKRAVEHEKTLLRLSELGLDMRKASKKVI